MEGLKLKDSEETSAEGKDGSEQAVDKAVVFGKVLRILHACLANERSHIQFDVSNLW